MSICTIFLSSNALVSDFVSSVWKTGSSVLFFLHLFFVYVCIWSGGGIGNYPGRTIDEDTDFGGLENQYVILLENLDKGLSPSIVLEFIHRETSISPRVYLFLDLNSNPTMKGALMLDCEKKFQQLSDFLDNPNHIILSSSGRYVMSVIPFCFFLIFFSHQELFCIKWQIQWLWFNPICAFGA